MNNYQDPTNPLVQFLPLILVVIFIILLVKSRKKSKNQIEPIITENDLKKYRKKLKILVKTNIILGSVALAYFIFIAIYLLVVQYMNNQPLTIESSLNIILLGAIFCLPFIIGGIGLKNKKMWARTFLLYINLIQIINPLVWYNYYILWHDESRMVLK